MRRLQPLLLVQSLLLAGCPDPSKSGDTGTPDTAPVLTQVMPDDRDYARIVRL